MYGSDSFREELEHELNGGTRTERGEVHESSWAQLGLCLKQLLKSRARGSYQNVIRLGLAWFGLCLNQLVYKNCFYLCAHQLVVTIKPAKKWYLIKQSVDYDWTCRQNSNTFQKSATDILGSIHYLYHCSRQKSQFLYKSVVFIYIFQCLVSQMLNINSLVSRQGSAHLPTSL